MGSNVIDRLPKVLSVPEGKNETEELMQRIKQKLTDIMADNRIPEAIKKDMAALTNSVLEQLDATLRDIKILRTDQETILLQTLLTPLDQVLPNVPFTQATTNGRAFKVLQRAGLRYLGDIIFMDDKTFFEIEGLGEFMGRMIKKYIKNAYKLESGTQLSPEVQKVFLQNRALRDLSKEA